MNCALSLGRAEHLTLHGAILIYRGTRDAFATWHEVEMQQDSAPVLGPAQPLSTGFLKTLAEGLGSRVRAEILPDNVLLRTPDCLMWWSPACCRRMFFRETDSGLGGFNGHVFPHPPLVFRVRGKELYIRALRDNVRPCATTALQVAPYYNAQRSGLICQGSMRAPGGPFVDSITKWEDAFFDSEFTHLWGGGKMCRHKRGVTGLWLELAEKRTFPYHYLADAGQSLQSFAEELG